MNQPSSAATTLVAFMLDHGRPLFHITDERHLRSIAEHGLLSECERAVRNVVPACPGGNPQTRAFDADYGLSNYVFLGFSRAGLMPAPKAEWRPHLLHVDPRILLLRDVKLALGRDSTARWKIYGVNRALESMEEMTVSIFRQLLEGNANWDDVDVEHRWRIGHVMDFEVLIPKCVPPDFIAQ